MFLSDISIKRPVMVGMLMVALLLFGIMAYLSLPLNLQPSVDIPFVTVQTLYPGASPDQVDSQITKKIEDEISVISQIKTIESYSLNSMSLIIIEFELDKDTDTASQEVKDKLDLIINDLPSDAKIPVASKVDISASPVITLALSGDIDPAELYYLAKNNVKDRLSRLEGVGSVDILGGQKREVNVKFSKRTVYENNISLPMVAGILAKANMDMPGGNFQNRGQDYAVSLEGQLHSLRDVDSIMIPAGAGMRRLDQLALIEEGPEKARQRISFFNNETKKSPGNTVLISVVKNPEGNPVNIAEAISRQMENLKKELPESVHLNITRDSSTFIKSAVEDTLNTILLGIILTALILLLFLHDARSTLIATLSMPLSIIPTFIILKNLGITINIMSLMGLSTAVGVLVMNSVIVLENIFRHKDMGHSSKKAASTGSSEIAVAVMASTLTNVCVFLPIGTMDGMAGLFLRDFALTVVISTIFSLLIALTLTPMLATLILPDKAKKKSVLSLKIEGFFKKLEKAYALILEKILYSRKRSLLVIAATVLVFLGAMLLFAGIPFEFSPAMDSGELNIQIELSQDRDLEKTAELVQEIESRLAAFDEVKYVSTTMGRLSMLEVGTNLASLDIKLVDKHLRAKDSLVADAIGKNLADIPGAVIRTAAAGNSGGRGGAPIQFYLQAENHEDLASGARKMKTLLQDIPGLTGITMSQKEGKAKIALEPDRRELAEAGITVSDLAMALRSALEGLTLTQMKPEGQEYDIRVSLLDGDVSSMEKIQGIPVHTPRGVYPLSHFAQIKLAKDVNQLLKINKTPSITFGANIAEGYVLGNLKKAIDKASIPLKDEGFTVKWGGDADMMQETMKNMFTAFIIAVILTYMLLAAILEKLAQPLLILSTVPLSLIGVVAIFLLTGSTMNMISMMAIIMLVGMVVNNAILILDYTNQLRAKGMGVRDALLEACPTKLQAILMANTATILGLTPMALGMGDSAAEVRQPMGLVSIGGLLTATLLTLFFIPAVENAMEHKKEKKKIGKIGKDTES